MTARLCAFASVFMLLSAVSSVFAAERTGRYTLTPLGDAALRLDSETGAISRCRETGGGFACEAVTDDVAAGEDVAALKAEIDRLALENKELRERLAAAQADETEHGTTPPPPSSAFRVPDVEFDQMTEFVAKMMKRFQDMVRELKEPPAERTL